MATFPSITPDYGASKESTPKIRRIQFGDGYEQRIRFGLNQNPKVWSLSWTNITETEADTIEAFLDERASDGASFDWVPLGETTSYRWVCEQWTKTIPYNNRATISANFRQVFEP